MNSVALHNSGTRYQYPENRAADTVQMNRHISHVIYKIRDYGPAILDGNFYQDSRDAALPGKAKAPVISACAPSADIPVVFQLSARGLNRAMLFSIALLTVALISVGFYAYQQKLHVNDLQAELKIYDDLDKNF